MINQIKEREEELENERNANAKLKRELNITMHKMEQMKAEAPKKAFKPVISVNYGQEEINRFFAKLITKKDKIQKENKTAGVKGPWTKTCCIKGCKKRASDEPRYQGRCFNCQIQNMCRKIDFVSEGKDDLI